MQYAIAFEMKYKRLKYSHSLAEAVHHSLVIMLCLPIKRHLISLSPSSESLAPSSDSFVNQVNAITLPCTAAILSAILEFVIGFVSNFYSWCALSLLTIQRKDEVTILINSWATATCSVSRTPFCPRSWNLLSDLCQTSTTHVCCHHAQFSENTKSLY